MSMDLEYLRAVVDGSWPDADAVIGSHRERAARRAALAAATTAASTGATNNVA
ncbi:hypothetical protein [Paraburkholderia sp. UCT31]|uniref:hypothetical protein n=1 Tax=Paraburkholderia sp. UCT31 TaxID=2615209 RepID=UPI0016563E3A|nr:hypothetical protein [Paraburkholderia sp. UCT31]